MQILHFDWLRYYRSIGNSHRVAKFVGFVNLLISFYSQINFFFLLNLLLLFSVRLFGDTKTSRPFALKGHWSIAQSASPHGLLPCSPFRAEKGYGAIAHEAKPTGLLISYWLLTTAFIRPFSTFWPDIQVFYRSITLLSPLICQHRYTYNNCKLESSSLICPQRNRCKTLTFIFGFLPIHPAVTWSLRHVRLLGTNERPI